MGRGLLSSDPARAAQPHREEPLGDGPAGEVGEILREVLEDSGE